MYTGEEHENIINELIQGINGEGVDMAKVSLLIQDLRNNYNEVNITFAENTAKFEDVNKSIEGLKSANNKLLLQLGSQYSEILGRDKNEIINPKPQPTPQPQEETMSLEDIAKELI